MIDWNTVIISFLTSSAFGGLLIWFVKKAIQHEYDVKLEGFKAGYQKVLAENEIRFSWWYEEKAKAIKEIYSDLSELAFCLQYLQTLETDPRWQINGKDQVRSTLIARFVLSIEHSAEKWLKLRLFLGDMEDQKVSEFRIKTDQLFTLYAHSVMNNTADMLKSEGEQILRDINAIMDILRHNFQDILQGKDSEK